MKPPTLNRAEAVDHNAFTGSWPFRFLGEAAQPRTVEMELREAGIASAWISALDALFNAEPYTANEWLIRETARSEILRPVPVFNPRLRGAAKELRKLLDKHPEIPAIRLVPGYHGYQPNEPEARAFVEQAPPEKPVLLTLRVQDRRGQPPLFPVPDPDIGQAFALAHSFREHTFLFCGARLGDITTAKEECRRNPNVHFETSFIDNISGIADCADILGDGHLHLGTLAPLFYAAASVEKIRNSGLTDDRIQRILTGSL